MPVHEYICRACSRSFDELVFDSAAPPCPTCQAADVERVLSLFAVGRGQGPAPVQAAGSCGSCGDPRGPGACGLS